jgi:hypothetical protein
MHSTPGAFGWKYKVRLAGHAGVRCLPTRRLDDGCLCEWAAAVCYPDYYYVLPADVKAPNIEVQSSGAPAGGQRQHDLGDATMPPCEAFFPPFFPLEAASCFSAGTEAVS